MNRSIVLLLALATTLFLLAPNSAQSQETKEVPMITGLDGGTYEAYDPALVERVQQALREKGLYQGEVNGVLDQETMEAIGEFQQQNNIMVSGVPSPHTRQALLGEQ